MKISKIILLIILSLLILISGFTLFSCFSERDRESVREIRYIKQEFLDKSSERNITFIQKEQELKDIRRELIRIDKPDNKNLRGAYDKCLLGMDKSISSLGIIILMEKLQKKGASQNDIEDMFEDANKLLMESTQLFYEVDSILEDY